MAMRKSRFRDPKRHAFRNKLLLNQWIVSFFGIDTMAENRGQMHRVHPFHKLADPVRDPRLEGVDHDNLHHFYHALVGSNLFWSDQISLGKEQILGYEENIVRHTRAINEKRGETIDILYLDILARLFNNAAGGFLQLSIAMGQYPKRAGRYAYPVHDG